MIIPLRHENADAAAALLTQAFLKDPLHCYVFANPKTHAVKNFRVFRHYLNIMIDHGLAYTTEALEGVALWLPPQYAHGFPVPLMLRYGLLQGFCHLGLSTFVRAMIVERDAMRRHHKEMPMPHYTLDVLGVHPLARGRGTGKALVKHVLAQARENKTPAYVMTHNEINIPFYQGCGFELIDKQQSIPKGPPTISLGFQPK